MEAEFKCNYQDLGLLVILKFLKYTCLFVCFLPSTLFYIPNNMKLIQHNDTEQKNLTGFDSIGMVVLFPAIKFVMF